MEERVLNSANWGNIGYDPNSSMSCTTLTKSLHLSGLLFLICHKMIWTRKAVRFQIALKMHGPRFKNIPQLFCCYTEAIFYVLRYWAVDTAPSFSDATSKPQPQMAVGYQYQRPNGRSRTLKSKSATTRGSSPQSHFHRVGSPRFFLHLGTIRKKYLSKVIFLFIIIFVGI